MNPTRPFRFGFTGGASSKRVKLLDSAQAVEAMGYSTFGLADHLVRPFAPLIAGQAVADATTSLRVTQTVLAQDFREPVAAGQGARHPRCPLRGSSPGRPRRRVVAPGVRRRRHDFEPAPVRIARLEETAVILKGLFADGPFSSPASTSR